MTVGDRVLTLTAKGAIKAGARVLPLVPDDLLVSVSRRSIAKVPWPEGQAFIGEAAGHRQAGHNRRQPPGSQQGGHELLLQLPCGRRRQAQGLPPEARVSAPVPAGHEPHDAVQSEVLRVLRAAATPSATSSSRR